MKFSFSSTKLAKVLILLLPLTALVLAAFGCAGPAVVGWSGLASSGDMLYFGSMDGRVLAVKPSARSAGLSFPSENDGEWVRSLRFQAASGGSICGPGCVPVAQQVAAIYGTPVVAGDLVCVATYAGDSGRVMAINRMSPGYSDGEPLRSKGEWIYPGETKTIGSVVGNPVLVKDTLYIGSSDGRVYALDAVYGEKKWEFDTGGKIWTTPAVSDGVVYVSNYAKQLYAISAEDGKELWPKPIELPAAIASSPVVSDGKVFFGTFDQFLYAVSSSDGKEVWKFKGGGWFWATPLVKDGVVYAGCLDHKLYARDASTGKELWQFEADSSIVSPPVLVANVLIVCSESGSLYMREVDNGMPVHDPIPIGHSVMAPLYTDGKMVYAHARDDNVYCVDIQSGQMAWHFSPAGK